MTKPEKADDNSGKTKGTDEAVTEGDEESIDRNGDTDGADDAKDAKSTSSSKRPLGAKEVVPFAWKLVGVSQNVALTLFKAVERAEVEAQFERVRREGYYTDLRIMDNDEKVVQPKPIKPPVRKRVKRKTPTTVKKAPAKASAKKKKTKTKTKARKTAASTGTEKAKKTSAKSTKKKTPKSKKPAKKKTAQAAKPAKKKTRRRTKKK